MEEKFKILTVEQARNNIYSVVSDSNIGGVVYTEEIATPPCVVVVQNSDSFFLKAFAPRRNILEKLSGNLVNKFDNTNMRWNVHQMFTTGILRRTRLFLNSKLHQFANE